MSTTHLFTAVVEMLLLWLSISVHEAAHAWVAERCGDATPRLLGRVSLNPLRHLDVLGSVLLPLLLVIPQLPVFGWGRRPYWVTRNLRRPYWHSLLVNAAGPAANLLLAALAVVALGIAAPLLGALTAATGELPLDDVAAVVAEKDAFYRGAENYTVIEGMEVA